MSKLPKLPAASGIPSSGLPSPAGKRRTSTGTTGKSTLALTALTPEQEELLQVAMKQYNPTAATELNESNQTSSSNSQINSTSVTNNQSTSPLRKPRRQSVSKMTRPTLPPLTEKSAAKQHSTIHTPHTVSSKLSSSNSGLPASNLSSPLQRSLSSQNQNSSTSTPLQRSISSQNHNSSTSTPLQRSLSGQNHISNSSQPLQRSLSGQNQNSLALNPIHQRLQVMAAPQQRPASPSLSLFSVGERVTVESMNISGTLRFLGQIENKSGTWAGIELDVPGTGKNDGSANGKSYFTCPPKSGIFVLASKLTNSKEVEKAPKLPQISTINKSSPRSPSVSSNSSDKASSGVQSSLATQNVSKHAQNAAIAAGRITAGSRASKYIGVTASQLKQRTLTKPSTVSSTPDTDTASNTAQTAPSKTKTLTLGLVKPGSLQNLKSSSTPPTNGRQYRNRKDSSSSTGSAVSNISQSASYVSKTSGLPRSRSVTPNPPNESQHTSDSENTITTYAKEEMSNKSLQEKVQKYMLSDPDTSDSVPLGLFDQQALKIQRLQMKIEVLETENTYLKLDNKKSQTDSSPGIRSSDQWEKEKKALLEERDLREKTLNDKISDLSRQLQEVAKGHHHRPSTSLSMIADDDNMSDKILQLTELVEQKDEHVKSLEETLSKQSSEYQSKIKELELASLGPQNEASDRISQLEKEVQDKTSDIDQLNAKFGQYKLESENKVKALQKTIDEFKAAGQETINIYEEKVSSLEQQVENLKKAGAETISLYEEAKTRITEREDKINSLEREAEELRSAGVEAIDVYEKTIEETKKDVEEFKNQLVKKEEAITTLSKEADRLQLVQKELAEAKTKLEMNDKREEGLRNELGDLQSGLEQMMRADAKSRGRIYQLEEDVRESQALVERQLEEINALKNNMQNLMDANNNEEVEKVKAVFESDTKRLQEELEGLRKFLSEVQTEKRTIVTEADSLKDEKKVLERKMQESERQRKDMASELEALKISIKQNEDEKEQIISQLEGLKVNVTKVEEQKNKLIQESEVEKKVLVEEYESAKKELIESREIVEKELTEARESVKKELIESREIAKKELIEARESAQKELEELQKQLADLTKKAEYAEQLKSELDIKAQELKKLSEDFEEAKNESERLKAAKNNSEESSVKSLEDLKIEYENKLNVYKVENDQLKQKVKDLALANKNIPDTLQNATQDYEEKISAYEEQITGLKHIVHELTRENVSIAGDNKKILAEQEKLMEAHKQVENECFKLMDELERLHSESLNGQGVLNLTSPTTEDSYVNGKSEGNQEISEDTQNGGVPQQNINGQPIGGDLMRLQSLLSEKQTQLERLSLMHNSEIRELRKKVSDLEKSKQKEINALNKDVAELESLIESKIFREADLEEEIQREQRTSKRLVEEIEELREQLNETRNSNGVTDVLETVLVGNGITSNNSSIKPNGMEKLKENGTSNLYCEICEQEGHDVISCKAVFGSHSTNITENKAADDGIQNESAVEEKPYCDNCEEFGQHWTEECPNSDVTF